MKIALTGGKFYYNLGSVSKLLLCTINDVNLLRFRFRIKNK